MNVKALIEKRENLKNKLKEMTDLAVTEVRALNSEEEQEYTKIEEEIRGLEKTINLIESRKNEKTLMTISGQNQLEDSKELEARGIESFIRKTDTEELRNMSTTSNGGIVPTHLHSEIIEKLVEVAPLFAMIPKLTPVSGNLEILKETSVGDASFVGEATDLSESAFDFDKIKLEQRRCGSVVQLTQKLINDSGVDIVEYAKNILFRRLGYALDRAIVNGQVSSEQFEGLVVTKDKSECKVESLVSQTISIDDFMNTLNSLHPVYQEKAVWIMDRKTFNQVALMKDAVGNYYLNRDVINGKPQYRLFGCNILINDAVHTDVVAHLVDITEAYAGMIKKDTELKHINADTKNALKGSATLVLDMYADAKIKNLDAIKTLVKKA